MRLVNHSHPISGVGALTADRPDHLPEIRDGLRAGISALAVHLLGDPVRGGRTTKTLKFGTRSGSLHVEISGPKQGLWFDHAENLGGDALALIQHINGGSFPDAVSWAANWLGIDIGRPVPKPAPDHAAAQRRERERKRAEAAAQEAQDAAERVSRAPEVLEPPRIPGGLPGRRLFGLTRHYGTRWRLARCRGVSARQFRHLP